MNTADRQPLAALGRIGIVAGLHVAALYFIAAGLGVVPALKVDPMVGEIIPQAAQPEEAPPPVDQPVFENRPVIIPQPFVEIPVDDSSKSLVPVVIDDGPVRLEIIPSVRGPLVVGVRPDARHPLSQPPYPVSAIRNNYEGAVEIEVYVLPNGRVGDARVVKSAGYPELDQAALDEAKRRWRLLPATRDGEPFAQWHKLRVVFDLKDR